MQIVYEWQGLVGGHLSYSFSASRRCQTSVMTRKSQDSKIYLSIISTQNICGFWYLQFVEWYLQLVESQIWYNQSIKWQAQLQLLESLIHDQFHDHTVKLQCWYVIGMLLLFNTNTFSKHWCELAFPRQGLSPSHMISHECHAHLPHESWDWVRSSSEDRIRLIWLICYCNRQKLPTEQMFSF